MDKDLRLRRSKKLIVRDFLLYLSKTSQYNSDWLTEEEKAYILAKIGYRPTMSARDLNRNKVLILPTKSPKRFDDRAYVVNHILDIVRLKQGVTKYELIKECERSLVTKQEIILAINNALNKLMATGLIRVIHDKSNVQFGLG